MSTELAERQERSMTAGGAELLEKVVVQGDLAQLSSQERLAYYARVCESLGLNPYTRPFDYIMLNNKLTLYARREAAEQLRSTRGISITREEHDQRGDLYVVRAYGKDKTGREDVATGAVSVKGLAGDNLANAVMKAETKAKRRLTLSLAGLGWLDETEVDSIADARRVNVDPNTGEIQGPVVVDSTPRAAQREMPAPKLTQAQVRERVKSLRDRWQVAGLDDEAAKALWIRATGKQSMTQGVSAKDLEAFEELLAEYEPDGMDDLDGGQQEQQAETVPA